MEILCPQSKLRSLNPNNATYLGLLCLLRGFTQKEENTNAGASSPWHNEWIGDNGNIL